MLMVLPPLASEIGSALLAMLTTLAVVRRRPKQPHDVEREIAALTLKVRHPWKARIRRFIGASRD